jgi:hypothetical protein
MREDRRDDDRISSPTYARRESSCDCDRHDYERSSRARSRSRTPRRSSRIMRPTSPVDIDRYVPGASSWSDRRSSITEHSPARKRSRSRDRDRDRDRDRVHRRSRDRDNDRPRRRSRSRSRRRDRSRDADRARARSRSRSPYDKREKSRSRDGNRDRDRERDREHNKRICVSYTILQDMTGDRRNKILSCISKKMCENRGENLRMWGSSTDNWNLKILAGERVDDNRGISSSSATGDRVRRYRGVGPTQL